MKSNAIVRIVIWSVVILVLLAVLIAGLANNLFTVFRDNTNIIHHDSLEVSQSVLVMSETNIYEMPNDQSKVKGTLAAGDAVVIGLDLGRDGGRLLRAVFRQGGLLSGGAAQAEHQQDHGDENEQRNCDQLAFGNFGSHDDHRDSSYACLID